MRPTVHVLATTVDGTRAALTAAIPFAKGSNARLVILVPRIAPVAISDDQPVESTHAVVQRYCDLLEELNGEAHIRLCVCRRLSDVVAQLLSPRETVVIGGSVGRWVPSAEMRFVRRLKRLGHAVIFVPGPIDGDTRAAHLTAALMVLLPLLVAPHLAFAQAPNTTIQYGAFVDIGRLFSSTSPSNHLFRNRGTTPRVDEWDLNNGYWHLAHANDVLSFGGQVAYKATDRVTVKETVLYGPHQTDTALRYWRFFSDTILERKIERVTAALEYQIGAEGVATPGDPRALWMAAQAPVKWLVGGPWSLVVRPELAWDRDGRWIGAEQSVKAFTSTLEYRRALGQAQAIVKLEYRVDDSRGSGGGFFADADVRPGVPGLAPTQHLFGIGLIFTFDGTIQK